MRFAGTIFHLRVRRDVVSPESMGSFFKIFCLRLTNRTRTYPRTRNTNIIVYNIENDT